MSDATTRLNAALEGRYRIERQLGEGGMATVYLAEDLKHKRRVALKVLKPELAAVVGAERFLAEIETTANLQHPHILPLFDSGEADGFLFYVMPWVEGESLRERIDREHQLPLDEAVAIVTKVAGALATAHERGVIHRDVKPANILLSKGEPLVSDFGIALAVSAGGAGRLTETGLSLGTPHYMSPEQATGDASVGPATDIYALGCVLYEMLVGEPPYTGSTPQAILGKIIQAEPVSATKARRSVPGHVDAAIRKALEKIPADRFTGAHALAKALSDPSFRYGTSASVAGGTSSARLWNPLSIGLGVATGVLAAALFWSLGRPAPMPAEVTRLSIVVPADRQIEQGGFPSRPFSISPDGRTIAYVAREPAGRSPIFVRSLDSPTVRELPGTEEARQPFFSPEGSWVAYLTGGGELWKAPVGGGNPLRLAQGIIGPSWGFGAWTDEGEIVFGGRPGGLLRVSADGGAVDTLTTTGGASGALIHWQPVYVPSTRSVLFTETYDGGERILALNLDTRAQHVVVEGASDPMFLAGGHLLFERDGTLVVAPFDESTLELAGSPAPLEDDVLQEPQIPQWAISRSGTLIYRPGAAAFSTVLGIVDRGGRFESLGEESYDASMDLSPDGRLVAFEAPGSDAAVLVRDLVGGGTTRWAGVNRPAWHPDGRRAVVASARGTLAVREADGRLETLVTAPVPGARLTIADWSPDGRTLAYTLQNGNEHDIWVVSPGEPARPLLDGPAREFGPAFSPNGRWLAYVSDETGRREVYMQRYPAGERQAVSTGGGAGPRWSSRGDELFFVGSPEGPPTLFAVPVRERGEMLEIGEPQPLFAMVTPQPNGTTIAYEFPGNSTTNYDVFPDGQHFVMSRGIQEPRRELVIVQNFFEEARRLAPKR